MFKKFFIFITLVLVTFNCSKKIDEVSETVSSFPVLAYDAELLETLTLDKKNIIIDEPNEILYWSQHFQNPKNNLNHIKSNSNFKNKKKIMSGKNSLLNIIQPIYFSDKICNVSNNGFLDCYDLINENSLFRTNLKPDGIEDYEVIRGGIAYFNGQIISVDAYGQVVSIDSEDGSIKWSTNIGFPVLSPPLIYRDNIYFISSDNRIFCISIASGDVEWSFQTISETRKNLFTASPVAYENIIVAPFSNGELVAFLYDTGRLVWSESLAKVTMVSNFDIKDISASPVIYKNNLFALSSNGKLASVNIINGQRNWSINLSGYRTPLVTGNQIYVINNDGKLVCIDIKSGDIYWITDLGKFKKGKKAENLNLWLGPFLINENLYILSYFGELKIVSPFTGSIISSQDVGIDKILVPPVITTEAIFVSNENSHVFKFQ